MHSFPRSVSLLVTQELYEFLTSTLHAIYGDHVHLHLVDRSFRMSDCTVGQGGEFST